MLTFRNELWTQTSKVYIKVLSESPQFYICTQADPEALQHLWKCTLKQLLPFCVIVTKSSILDGGKFLDSLLLDSCLNFLEPENLRMCYHLTSSDQYFYAHLDMEKKKLHKAQHKRPTCKTAIFLFCKLKAYLFDILLGRVYKRYPKQHTPTFIALVWRTTC